MEQKEIITALHNQLKEAAQRIFKDLVILPGNYTAAEIDKTFNLSAKMDGIAIARRKARKEPMRAESELRWVSGEMARLEEIGIPDEEIKIAYNTFNASMPAALVFAKLTEWEREFKIKTTDKALFVKEEEGEAIASCIVEFPKEAKYIADYCATDMIRPMMIGVYIDAKNSCMVASDTHVLTEIPVVISEMEGEPMNITVDPKIIKAVAGQRCEVKLMKDVDKNISIKTEKGEVYSCANIKGNYPAYRRVYPMVNRDGLVELTKEGAKALINFAKGTVKQTKEKRGGNVCIKIEIPAYSDEGTATYFDMDYQTEKIVKFAIKGSPRIDIVFGIDAFNLSIVTKNWNGCMWFTDPSRPVVFDNINTTCTISMPMQLLDNSKSGYCAGVVEAIKRHGVNYDVALSESKAEEKHKDDESKAIPREKKFESAMRYCSIKGNSLESLTDNDEIIAVTPEGCKARYVGRFRRSGDMVLFDCKNNFISVPKKEPEPPTPTDPPQSTETDTPPDTSPTTKNAVETNLEPPKPTIKICLIVPPPKQINFPRSGIWLVSPPQIKIIITPKIRNHDRNNSLAYPHNLDYEPRNASNLACIADCRACYPPDNVVHKCSQGNLCNSPPRKDHEKTKSETARQMGRDRPTSRARPSTPAERKDRETKTSENSL